MAASPKGAVGSPALGLGSRSLPEEAVKGQVGDQTPVWEPLGDVFLGLEKRAIGSSSWNGERGQLAP